MNLSASTVYFIRSHLPSPEWTGGQDQCINWTSVWTGLVHGLTLFLICTARLAKRFPHQKWAPCKVRGLFAHMRTAWPTQSQLTKVYLELRPEMAMLSAPFGCTHPPPPIPPFLLKQNLSPKVIAVSDITWWNFHAVNIRLHPEKG